MAKLVFKDIYFEDKGSKIRVNLLKNYYFDMDKDPLTSIGYFKISKNSIYFKAAEKKASRKLNFLFEKGFKELRNKLNGKKTVYVYEGSGMPLIGNISFGLVDRNTSLIEVKPLTGCNLNCIFCSIDQAKRAVDFVVEADYLVEEFRKLVQFKKCNNIEAHINAHGEPLLYADIIGLIKGLSSIKQVKTVSMDTNAVMLNKELVDKLVEAGLTRFNISLNAISPEKARQLAGCPYDVEKVKETCRYIAKLVKNKKTDMLIAPVRVSGYNDDEIPKLIEFALKLGVKIFIQNYLQYSFGKRPAKQMPFPLFYKELRELEKRYNIQLIIDLEKDFGIKKTMQLPKPFRKGDIIRAEVVCNGSFPDEKMAVAGNRTISVPNCSKKGIIKLKVVRSKHNIFVGKIL